MLKPIQKEELSDILHKLNKEHQIMQVKEQEHYFFAVSAVVHGKYTEDELETVYSHVVPSNQWKYVSIECMDADSQLKPEEQEMVSYLQAILIRILRTWSTDHGNRRRNKRSCTAFNTGNVSEK